MDCLTELYNIILTSDYTYQLYDSCGLYEDSLIVKILLKVGEIN